MKPRNYCGAQAPHRSSKCLKCQAIRQRDRRARIKAGLPLDGPRCALCGIARDNSFGVKVYRYSLVRNHPAPWTKTGWTNKQIGSVPLCDRCIIEGGYARPEIAVVA